MTVLVVVLTGVAAGAAVGRLWALALPPVGLGVVAVVEAAIGPAWMADTPVVAIALVSEAALATGVLWRRWAARRA